MEVGASIKRRSPDQGVWSGRLARSCG